MLALSVVLAWAFNNTNGSVLIAMLFHAAINTVSGSYFFRMFTGAELVRLWWLYAAVWWVAAGGVIWRAGAGRLSRFKGEPGTVAEPA